MKIIFTFPLIIIVMLASAHAQAICPARTEIIAEFAGYDGLLKRCKKDLLHRNGNPAYLVGSGTWYTPTGAQIYYSNTGNIYYANGVKAFSAQSKNWFHPSGARAFTKSTGNWFYSNGQIAYSFSSGNLFDKKGKALPAAILPLDESDFLLLVEIIEK